ncbi:MAG TPA: translation elongation factor Ts [Bryobacteraceae bacterium]|jgi:elongation factor Ts|nr:translation elongation factor Ts [Bryobacteraceae bacterium]
MAEISAQLVKQLREMTGAGFLECKKALAEAGGDIQKAVDVLKTRGLASAGKKEGRSTKQGLLGVQIVDGDKSGVIVEVNCESDFVARTEDFQNLVRDITEHIAELKPTHVRNDEVAHAAADAVALYEQQFTKDKSQTVSDIIKSKIAKLGENISVSRFALLHVSGSGLIGSYVHTGAQVGTLVEIHAPEAAIAKADFETLVRDIAMQVTAANPQFISREDVSADALAREKAIQRERALKEGKPEKMVDKIAEGRLAKFFEEVCLLEQPFIKDNAMTVGELIRSKADGLGEAKVARFVRYKVGEAADTSGAEASPLPVTQ